MTFYFLRGFCKKVTIQKPFKYRLAYRRGFHEKKSYGYFICCSNVALVFQGLGRIQPCTEVSILTVNRKMTARNLRKCYETNNGFQLHIYLNFRRCGYFEMSLCLLKLQRNHGSSEGDRMLKRREWYHSIGHHVGSSYLHLL